MSDTVSVSLGRVSVVPRGEYDPTETYKRLDVVRRAGSSYLALRDGLRDVLPVDGENWMCLVERSGKSAYEQAVDAGLAATEAEFKTALAKIVDAWGDWDQGLTDEEASDPEIVYERTRPVDWLSLPALEDVQDGELWLLFQWLPGDTCTCNLSMRADIGTLTVEAGRYEDGVFTPNKEYTESIPTRGSGYSLKVPVSLNGADFGDMTAQGKVQAVVRVSGPMTQLGISSKYNCVDAAIKVLNMTNLSFSDLAIVYISIAELSNVISGMTFSGCKMLKAIRGSAKPFNALADCSGEFQNCQSLLALPQDVTFRKATGVDNMFRNCSSLRRLPEGITFSNNVGSGSYMFASCYNLRFLPAGFTFGQLNGSCHYMLYNCYNLQEIPMMDLEMATDLQGAFSGIYHIDSLPSCRFPNAVTLTSAFASSMFRSITGLYIPVCKSLSKAFSECYALEELTFAEDMETWATPDNINLTNTRLGHAAIVALFESLPTITAAKTITLTGTPGASQVTAEDIAIADAKGWKVAGTAVATASSNPGIEGPESFDEGYSYEGEPYQW